MEPVKQRLEFPRKYLFLLSTAAPYKVGYGGRGGIKSWTFAQALTIRASQEKKRIVCGRLVQNSIQDSVYQLLVDTINRLGLKDDFLCLEQTIISLRTGSTFVFKGFTSNIDSFKSLEGADILWVEEAAKIPKKTWEKILPTMRKLGCEVWVTYNPDEEDDATHQMFVVDPLPGTIAVKTGWQDNKWFTPQMHALRKWLQRTDPDAYAHVWEGECKRRSKSQILSGKWRVGTLEEITAAELAEGTLAYGADWGFAQDPTTLIRCKLVKGKLYITHERYQIGLELSDTAKLFLEVPGAGNHAIRGDSARPETISYLQKGQEATPTRAAVPPLKIEGVEKWKGSVEDGIAFLRALEEIVISPNCEKTIEEARKYSYKVDKNTGDVQPEIVDAWNHCWDAIRYALQPIIKTSRDYDGFIKFLAEEAAKAEAQARAEQETKALAHAA